jgi:hypothetical protein
VTFLAALVIVEGSLASALAGLLVFALMWTRDDSVRAHAAEYVYAVAAMGISGLTLLISSVGLLRMRPWSWVAIMTTQCVMLISAMYTYLTGKLEPLPMALGVIAVLLMNRREVRSEFLRMDVDVD